MLTQREQTQMPIGRVLGTAVAAVAVMYGILPHEECQLLLCVLQVVSRAYVSTPSCFAQLARHYARSGLLRCRLASVRAYIGLKWVDTTACNL